MISPHLFVKYLNDLYDGITSICKIFVDDTSFFSKFIDTYNFQNTLNCDLDSYWQLGLPMKTAIKSWS